MKIYMHFEGSPDFTLPIIIESSDETFGGIAKKFVNVYNSRFPSNQLSDIVITDSRGTKFDTTAFPAKKLQHGDDIFIILDEKSEDHVQTAETQKILEWIKKSYATANDAVQKGNLRAACSIYQRILQIVPSEKRCLHHLGEIYQFANKYDKAINYYYEGFKNHPEQAEFHSSLAECYFEKSKHDVSLKYAKSALSIIERTNPENLELKSKMQVLIGKCLYQLGQRDIATKIFMDMLEHNEEHVGALFEYGRILFDKGLIQNSLKIFLKLLVLQPESTTIQEFLTSIVTSQKEGIKMINEELKSTPSTAPALAYLASVIKNHGAVKEAIILYEQALDLVQEHAGYCLALVHTLEIVQQYNTIFGRIKQFCKQNLGLKVGNLRCEHIYQVIGSVETLSRHTNVSVPELSVAEYNASVPFSAQELDLLALFFTLIKVLFVCGCFELIRPLVTLIDNAKGNRELHLTTIRNEHAYYCCICQLMINTEFLTVSNPVNPLHVVGDSHCLPLAWRHITMQTQERIMIPQLVTGLKIWHLRPESKFYPKVNFESIMSSIPNGSDIVMLLGEIDCREGFLVSVEKCKYETVEEAAGITIDIFLAVLKTYSEKRGHTIYVHPVVPVLDETRHIVMVFNGVLKKKMQMEAIKNVHLLDFFDQLLSRDGTLCSDFKLDGTHLNPKYIRILENTMKQFQ